MTREDDFDESARLLVEKVERDYALAAKVAHREETLQGTFNVWSNMLSICDQAIKSIPTLTANPTDKNQWLIRILDFRRAANFRRDLHS